MVCIAMKTDGSFQSSVQLQSTGLLFRRAAFRSIVFEHRHSVCRATIRSYNAAIIDNAIHAVRATVIAIVNIASVPSFPGP